MEKEIFFDDNFKLAFMKSWRSNAMLLCDRYYLWNILKKETGLDLRPMYEHLECDKQKEKAINYILEARYGTELQRQSRIQYHEGKGEGVVTI